MRLVRRQHHGQMGRLPSPHQLGELGHLHTEHTLVQEGESVQGLILRRRRNAIDHREVAQEQRDLGRSELRGMALAVKQDEPPHPVDVRLLGTRAVVAHPKSDPDPIEQTRRPSDRTGRRRRSVHGAPSIPTDRSVQGTFSGARSHGTSAAYRVNAATRSLRPGSLSSAPRNDRACELSPSPLPGRLRDCDDGGWVGGIRPVGPPQGRDGSRA